MGGDLGVCFVWCLSIFDVFWVFQLFVGGLCVLVRDFVGGLSVFCFLFICMSAICSKLRVHVLLVFCRHFVFFICMIHL